MANQKFKLILALLVILLGMAYTPAAADEPIPMDQQHQIIDNYLLVTGHKGTGASAAELLGHDTIPMKCGMSAVADFVLNRGRLDKRLLASLGLDSITRPEGLDKFYVRPSSHFKIHYTTTGADSVYRSHVVDANGVPLFVDSVAAIADRAWAFTIDTLGYPAPPSDSSYDPDGPQYDIYLTNLAAYFFGLTYLDSTQVDGPGSLRATSYMNLDNDYQQIPGYENRPLDAVRVTVAHEFFHTVQFGIDFSEAEIIGSGSSAQVRRYWMEMSAVWMEEQQYTSINDYYSYLPYFFDFPRTSIQQFRPSSDYHPYGSVVLPLYLSQKFGRDIIRDIWIKCGQFGAGPSFLEAADSSLAVATHGTVHWPQAFTEFALWNFFTGARAAAAPTGVGYAERANYPIIPDSLDVTIQGESQRIAVTQLVDKYQFPLDSLVYSRNKFKPEHNAASYMRLDFISNLATRYWTPRVGVNPDSVCVVKYVDSLKQSDTLVYTDPILLKGTTDLTAAFFKKAACPTPDSICVARPGCNDTALVHIDSAVTVYGLTGQDLPSGAWGLNVVYHYWPDLALHIPADSYSVESFTIPDNSVAAVEVKTPHRFESVTLIWSPASTNPAAYTLNTGLTIAFIMDETYGVDSTLVSVPGTILTPYPNPAVLSQMRERNMSELKFRFQIPTDTGSLPIIWSNPNITLDIFNVAGERVRTLTRPAAVDFATKRSESRTGQFETGWDMKNEAGKDVVSGVYIAVARLYVGGANTAPVAEQKVKVVIVR